MVAQVNTPVIAWLIYKKCVLGSLMVVLRAYLVETHREQSLG